MLCDLPGVLSFLGLPPETEMPPGNKGKTKLKKLYRKVAPNKAYNSGERAKDLISHLDMAEIRASAPVQELGCSSIRARGSFRLAGQLPLLQFNFQFGFVFVEVIAHVGDGK